MNRQLCSSQYLWLILISGAYLNAILPRALELYYQQGLHTVLIEGAGQSYISWFSLICVLMLILSSSNWRKHSIETPLLVAIALLCIVPFATASWLAFSLCGFYLLSLPCRSAKCAGILLFALSLRGPISALALNLFSQPLLAMDAQLSTWLLQLFGLQAERADNLIFRSEGVNLLILNWQNA